MAIFAAFASTACSDSTGPGGDGALQVHAFARGAAVQRAEQMGTTGAAVFAPGEVAAVRIDRILLVLGRVKLEKAGATLADFVDERSVVVSLTPGGGPAELLDLNIPSGEYKELELAFDKLERGNPREEPLIQQYPALADRSILIEGSVTGNGATEAFTFSADLDMDVEILFPAPRLIDMAQGDPLMASVVLDVEGWMRDAVGRLLDPRDPASRSAIEGNVQRSAELFEDPEIDGR